MTTSTWEGYSVERRLARILSGDHPGEPFATEALAYARKAFRRHLQRDPDIIGDFLVIWSCYSASRIERGQDFCVRHVRRSCLRDARRQTWRLRRKSMGLASDTNKPLRHLPSYIDCLDPRPLLDLANIKDGFPSPTLWARERGRVRRVSRRVSRSSILVDGDGVIQAVSYGRRGY